MKIKIFSIVLLVFLAGCSDVPTAKTSNKSSADESKRNGNRITSALAAYRADHTGYPESLSLLVPAYIPKIEPPVSGNPNWFYEAFDNYQRYNLSFKAGDTECRFDSKEFHWFCGAK